MINFIKSKPVISASIGLAFILITRMTEIVPAVLLFWFVSNLPFYSKSKKVMTGFSIAYIVLSVLLSFFNLVIVILKFVEPYQTFTFVSFGFLGLSTLIVLFLFAMFVVYLLLEEKETRNVLFSFVLILPMIGSAYFAIDGFATDALFDMIWNDGGNVVTLNLRSVSIFHTMKIMILVYLLARPKEELYE